MEYQNAFQSFAAAPPAEVLFACRACLATDIKLFDIQECDLAETFETVTGFTVPPEDGYPQHLCPYCFALLQKFGTFKERCKRSLEILETIVQLTRPLTTDYIRLIDRNAEDLSLSLSVHNKGTELVNIDPPIAEKVIQSAPSSAGLLQPQGVHKTSATELKEDYTFTYPLHKEFSVNTRALEDNPFALPGRKVFRSAAVALRAPARGLSPPPPLQEPATSNRPRKRRRTGEAAGEPVQRNKPGPREDIPEGYPGCGQAICHGLRLRGSPLAATALMLSNLPPATLLRYNAVFKQWWRFCQRRDIDPYKHSQEELVRFFTEKLDKGLKANQARLQRNALSLLLGKQINHDLDLIRLFKTVAATTPRLKNHGTWDPTVALNYLSTWYPNQELPLDRISKKLVTLLALCTGHGNASLARLKLDDLTVELEGVKICASRSNLVYWLPVYWEDPSICPVRCLQDYLRKSEVLRSADCPNLFINVKQPFGRAAAQTVTRWVHRTLVMCQVDMKVFEAPDGREVLSQYKSEFVSLEAMRRQAVCSARAEHFLRNYKVDAPVKK